MKKITFGGVFKESARIFRLHFKTIIVLVLLVMIPVGVITGISELVLLKNESVNVFLDVFSNSESSQNEIYESFYGAAPSLVPFLLVMLLVSMLTLLLPAAVSRLTLDEGRRGLLSRSRADEEMNVVHSDDFDLQQTSTATQYFTGALKMLPKIAACTLLGAVFAALGFIIMFLPGLIIAVIAGLSCYFAALTGQTFFKGLLGTGGAVVKRPLMFVMYLVSSAATLFTTFIVGLLLALIPLSGTAGIIGSVVITTVTLLISSLVSAFGSIAVSCYMINALDNSGYKRKENGFMEKEVVKRENPFQQ